MDSSIPAPTADTPPSDTQSGGSPSPDGDTSASDETYYSSGDDGGAVEEERRLLAYSEEASAHGYYYFKSESRRLVAAPDTTYALGIPIAAPVGDTYRVCWGHSPDPSDLSTFNVETHARNPFRFTFGQH